MKVFISHSSVDRWVARRISGDLQALGVDTFLDEKDIQTGESIDEAIQLHLKESDELLMLLSPQLLGSHWVLLEIGGAKALGKRLIPITMHIAANELPPPLSRGLARDINDIDRYYEEVAGRVSPSPAKRAAAAKKAAARNVAQPRPRRRQPLRSGTTVRLPERRPPDDSVMKVFGWLQEMDAYLGRSAKVTSIVEAFDNAAILDVDDGAHYWAPQWLDPVDA